MRIVYFARVREAVGTAAEARDVPAEVRTVGDLVIWLTRQGANYAVAFSDPARLRFALDQQMVPAATTLEGAIELAIFPPVTGG